jgi:anthranilate phosphoribosyltransferase
VHSESTGLDELVPAGSMFAVLVKRGLPSQELHLSCEDFGVSPLASVDALLGGTPQQNAARFRLLLTNCDNDAPLLSFVAMNAGAALWLADRAPSLRAGTDMAASAIRDGTVNAWLKSALE